jgi:hypothetical protein
MARARRSQLLFDWMGMEGNLRHASLRAIIGVI